MINEKKIQTHTLTSATFMYVLRQLNRQLKLELCQVWAAIRQLNVHTIVRWRADEKGVRVWQISLHSSQGGRQMGGVVACVRVRGHVAERISIGHGDLPAKSVPRAKLLCRK